MRRVNEKIVICKQLLELTVGNARISGKYLKLSETATRPCGELKTFWKHSQEFLKG